MSKLKKHVTQKQANGVPAPSILTSLQPGMVPDRKAWRNQTTLTGLAEFG